MTVLVTGGAGFIGSHLAEHLVSNGKTVTLLDDMSRGSEENIRELRENDRINIINCDITNTDSLEEIFSGHNQVYHLAARIGGVGYLRDNPADIITCNDKINYRVFRACVDVNIDRVLFASSSMLYSEADSFPTPETMVEELPPPRGSYGFQKLNGEYYCKSFQRQYGLDYVIARIFNGVGPRDWPGDTVGEGHVVPDMVRKIIDLKQNPVEVKGTGEQTRCFTDVRDLVDGLQRCMETPKAKNEAFNIGSTHEIKITELIKKIWSISERGEPLQINQSSSFARDVDRRVPDNSKAKEVLGWEPQHSLEDSLRWYINCYKREEEKEGWQ